jgi:DNA modification methylase
MSEVLHGDCLEIMRGMDAASVDAIVTDPPYELGFMGKGWDASGIAFNVEVWREALRVLRPGGYLLAFGGTRTYHRMTVAIEDAGFEIRDCIGWHYGSGFPKSLDVSKAVDSLDRTHKAEARARTFTAWMRSTGITAKQINEATRTEMGYHYTTHPTQPSVATADLFDMLRPLLPPVPDEIEELVRSRTVESENMKRREVLATRTDSGGRSVSIVGKSIAFEFNVTAPATDDAKAWAGWGTALKPAWEPVVVARKPLQGTVAANVLKYGTGAINVDACRVEGARWPANLLLTHGADCSDEGCVEGCPCAAMDASSGGDGASRFFNQLAIEADDLVPFIYAAKASRREREAGCSELPERSGPEAVEREADSAGLNSPRAGAGRTASGVRNHHPTVKPISVMEWCIRLVTREDALVLDPFCGSGTTGAAAVRLGRRFIGCEQSAEYVEIARARIAHHGRQLKLG